MKIAMFTNNYKPYVGGVPISIEHLAEALRAQGHQVYIFAPSYKNQKEEEDVIRYPSFPLSMVGAPIPNVLTGLFEQKVRELQIDVIHVHHPALVGNVALALQKKYGIPVVFTYHTRYEQYLHYVKPLEIFEHYTGAVERYLRWFSGRCDLLLAPTPGIKKYLETIPMDTPVAVLPTGIPEKNFMPDEARAADIRRQNIGNADYLFCTVARLAKEKNLDFQLEGLANLKEHLGEKGKTFRYMMIGDGPEREHIEKLAKNLGLEENVILTGNISNDEIAVYQKACDAFLFSSKSETQGIVLLEAMAVGNPVVAVEASGVSDVVENGKNGYLTKEDPKVWAERIFNMVLQPATFEQMRIQAKQTAEAYSEAEIARKAANDYFNAWMSRKEILHPVPFYQ